jgi:hypothetical protein
MRMPQSLKKQWVDALRSGEYIQSFNHLHSSTNPCAHCVIGVLDVLIGYTLSSGNLFFREWLKEYGIEDGGGNCDNDFQLIYNNKYHFLTNLNDITKLTFNELANLIEAQVEGY